MWRWIALAALAAACTDPTAPTERLPQGLYVLTAVDGRPLPVERADGQWVMQGLLTVSQSVLESRVLALAPEGQSICTLVRTARVEGRTVTLDDGLRLRAGTMRADTLDLPGVAGTYRWVRNAPAGMIWPGPDAETYCWER